ncbi:hypothetical protein CEXT_402521 [Caerostris extrusa]|uniref:Uncharacterized protein n=1 Tax=Caerostris extrusa TaxID=172846 RepID=A0AAV4WYR3_CAEEX|nr:hypothetical protein CEXT_402521 [Caerostris extrusa]
MIVDTNVKEEESSILPRKILRLGIWCEVERFETKYSNLGNNLIVISNIRCAKTDKITSDFYESNLEKRTKENLQKAKSILKPC